MMQAPFSKASKKYLAVTSKLVWLLVKGTKPSYSAMPIWSNPLCTELYVGASSFEIGLVGRKE